MNTLSNQNHNVKKDSQLSSREVITTIPRYPPIPKVGKKKVPAIVRTFQKFPEAKIESGEIRRDGKRIINVNAIMEGGNQ